MTIEEARSQCAQLQVLQVAHPAAALRGTFSVAYGGASTDSLPHDVSEERMELALEALPTLRDVQVTRQLSSDNNISTSSSSLALAFGYEWHVTFHSETPAVDNQRLSVNAGGVATVGGDDALVVTAAAAAAAASVVAHHAVLAKQFFNRHLALLLQQR